MAVPLAGCVLNSLHIYGAGVVLILGSFAPNGITNPVAANNKGKGFSVVRSGSAGLWTITFTNSALAVLSCWCAVQQPVAATSAAMQFGLIDTVTALTAQICNAPAGVGTDIAANANARVHFGFCMATMSLNT